MASHFKWYPSSEEVIVPFNARYTFPSQGQVIRLEFPAQGYVNPLNTTLEFDVTLYGYGTPGFSQVRFQNNIQSIFNRVRLLYGATPLEDMINYNVIVRNLTEWTGTNPTGTFDQTTINEGIGGTAWGTSGTVGGGAAVQGLVNVRQAYIQGIDTVFNSAPAALTFGGGFGAVPNSEVGQGLPAGTAGNVCTRRYQVNFALGVFTQDKLIPTKFMASQLAIELTLENAVSCIFAIAGTSSGVDPTYGVSNVNLIPEILEFDASYDAMFLQGLADGGVPLKFSSWHTFIFSTNGSSTANLLVQERSRSVKALFTVQRLSPSTFTTDTHAGLFDSHDYSNAHSSLQSYQYRIGGRYFPAAPVQCSLTLGNGKSNMGAEAFLELEKALNVVSDYRLSTGCNTLRWAMPSETANDRQPNLDYTRSVSGWIEGHPTEVVIPVAAGTTTGNTFAGNLGSGCFTMAVDLETSNGAEISGLNAEEQSDIALLANWASSQAVSNVLECYTYYDAMIVLRENNVLELIQ